MTIEEQAKLKAFESYCEVFKAYMSASGESVSGDDIAEEFEKIWPAIWAQHKGLCLPRREDVAPGDVTRVMLRSAELMARCAVCTVLIGHFNA